MLLALVRKFATGGGETQTWHTCQCRIGKAFKWQQFSPSLLEPMKVDTLIVEEHKQIKFSFLRGSKQSLDRYPH